jgi:ribosomal protein S8
MFYVLFKSDKVIGVFDSLDCVENMINGLKQHKLCSKSKLTVRKFHRNTICEVKNDSISKEANDYISKEDNDDNISKGAIENIKELTLEEEIERNKKKSELEYELTRLKKDKERIDESKKTFKVDLDLYKQFKKLKEENNCFEIPDLFVEKYKIFEMIDKEDKLDWENFYANYKQKNLSSSYSGMFDNDDAKTIN